MTANANKSPCLRLLSEGIAILMKIVVSRVVAFSFFEINLFCEVFNVSLTHPSALPKWLRIHSVFLPMFSLSLPTSKRNRARNVSHEISTKSDLR